MRLAIFTIALSLLIPTGCGTPVSASDDAGDFEGTAAAAEGECAVMGGCSEDKAECPMGAAPAECPMDADKADCDDAAKAEAKSECCMTKQAEAAAGTH